MCNEWIRNALPVQNNGKSNCKIILDRGRRRQATVKIYCGDELEQRIGRRRVGPQKNRIKARNA